MFIADNITVRDILRDVSIRCNRGSLSFLLGRSGSGKTTLLRAIAQLIAYDGTISLGDKNLATMRARERATYTGIVFQDFQLFPHKTVLENCMEPLLVHGNDKKSAKEKAMSLLIHFGLEKLASTFPVRLSGGQKQRVAICRALSLEPRLLLMDEPTASLDPYNSFLLQEMIKELLKNGLTCIIATQDMEIAKKMQAKHYFMEKGRLNEFTGEIESMYFF